MKRRSDAALPDRADAYRLDPASLKGLAHPLRVKLLGLLREYGPATASMLAARLGQSSGSTSYHLRQLAGFGFITEDSSRGSGRERWWKAAQASTYFDEKSFSETGDEALGAEFLKAVAGCQAARMQAWIERLPRSAGEWGFAGTLSDWALRLSPAELESLQAELEAVVARYRRFDPEEEGPEGTVFVAAQLQLLPRLGEEEA